MKDQSVVPANLFRLCDRDELPLAWRSLKITADVDVVLNDLSTHGVVEDGMVGRTMQVSGET